MNENVVHLAFTNPNLVKAEERAYLACRVCSNKTYLLLHFDDEFPTMQCAACGQHMGKMGWASKGEEVKP